MNVPYFLASISYRFFDNANSFPWWSNMPDDRIDEMATHTRSALDEMRA